MASTGSDDGRKLGFNMEESARALGIHRNTLAKLISEGRICPVRVGRRLILSRARLEKFLAESLDG